MTGYGRGSAQTATLEISVEISSVNRRNLEVSVNSPKEWMGLDQALSGKLREVLGRGKVSVSVRAAAYGGVEGLVWDDAAVKVSIERFQALAEHNGIPFEPSSAFLLDLVKAIRPSSTLPEYSAVAAEVLTAFDAALGAFIEMRATEGAALKDDLTQRLGSLKSNLQQIVGYAEGVVAAYRDRLFQRLRQLNLEDLDLDDERVLKEIALFADRCDISEEITRLNSHFEQFSDCLAQTQSTGRKMDFIIQEINREFNTIGSKANRIEISQAVIDAKNELERIREQAANVE